LGERVKDMSQNTKQCRFKLRSAYQEWIHKILNSVWRDSFWNGVQVTFMFNHIPGSFERKCEVMEDEIDRVYRTLVPHVVRSPRSRAGRKRLPILIAFPDTRQQPGCGSNLDATINDGLHYHGILLVNLDCRLKVRLDMHFKDHSDRYVRRGDRLRTIYIQPIDGPTAKRAVGYGFKSFEWRIPDSDRFFIRPRARRELPVGKEPRSEGVTPSSIPRRGRPHGVKLAPIPLTNMRAF
jgi:hypothetical protein